MASDFKKRRLNLLNSNIFGSNVNEHVHQFTGSVHITGSLVLNGEDVSGGGGIGTDTNAIHDNVNGEINTIIEKTILGHADLFLIEDASASFAKKKITAQNFKSGDPFINRFDASWDYAIHKWEFVGDSSSLDPFTITEPLGDAGHVGMDTQIGGAAYVYVDDTTIGRYIEMNQGGIDTLYRIPFNHSAVRVARKAHAGTLSHRFEVIVHAFNAAAYNRNLAGFRANGTGSWLALSANQTTEGTTNTGVSSADGNYRWLEWLMEPNQITYYIDGVQVAQRSTQLPGAVRGEIVLRGEVLQSATGNEDRNSIDAIMIKVERTGSLL